MKLAQIAKVTLTIDKLKRIHVTHEIVEDHMTAEGAPEILGFSGRQGCQLVQHLWEGEAVAKAHGTTYSSRLVSAAPDTPKPELISCYLISFTTLIKSHRIHLMSWLKDLLAGIGSAILGLVLILLIQNLLAGNISIFSMDQVEIFTTIFLGIFFEAAPFLLLGTLASGAVEVFIKQEDLARLLPRNPFLGVVFGGVLGFFFPVCECGVVPFTRRLFKKGLSPAVGISFLLAAPVLNPIVIASTYAAFGFGPVLYLRIGLSLAIAIIVGLVFAMQRRPERMLHRIALAPISGGSGKTNDMNNRPGFGQQISRVFSVAAEEFFEMGRYLVMGALLAALMQTFIPQPALLSLGTGSVSSILVMMALAVVLSVCSTVDAFIALAFVGTFTTGSILSFLVFGPMIDIKNVLMFLQVFRRRTVLYLILLPSLLTLLSVLYINLFTAL